MTTKQKVGMDTKKIEALVSLLDDDDWEVAHLVEREIKGLGGEVVPFLENHWEQKGDEPILQKRIEEIIHDIQLDAVKARLTDWNENHSDDLLKGLWAIATYQSPNLTLEEMQQQIQEIYFEGWLMLQENMHPQDQIKQLNFLFFEKFKFQPNTKHYHSVSNSMINKVLETKRGNPISMCAIYLIVAQRLAIPIHGVNFPNLFVLTYKTEGYQFYINVFNRGVVFSKADIDHYIKQMNIKPLDIFYEPCSNEDIVRRTLRNLVVSYEKADEKTKAGEILSLIKIFNEEHFE